LAVLEGIDVLARAGETRFREEVRNGKNR
jgi:hypothetical protein